MFIQKWMYLALERIVNFNHFNIVLIVKNDSHGIYKSRWHKLYNNLYNIVYFNLIMPLRLLITKSQQFGGFSRVGLIGVWECIRKTLTVVMLYLMLLYKGAGSLVVSYLATHPKCYYSEQTKIVEGF
jgi:hypothetical protein